MAGMLLDAVDLQEVTGLGRDSCYALFHMHGFPYVVIKAKKYTTREWVMQFLESRKETV